MPEAARVGDPVGHQSPAKLSNGAGSANVSIGGEPAWRAIPGPSVPVLQVQKTIWDLVVTVADRAAEASASVPIVGQALKGVAEALTQAASMAMTAAISGVAARSDMHQCQDQFQPVQVVSPVPHGPGVVTTASTSVFVNDMPAARSGDPILEAMPEPGQVSGGCSSVLIR